jgi:uncharacterized membrane protein YeaQ/YmgE (transglycosylase-associated protein family)
VVVTVSGLLFSIVLGIIGAIIVLLVTAGLSLLFKTLCKFCSWLKEKFTKEC